MGRLRLTTAVQNRTSLSPGYTRAAFSRVHMAAEILPKLDQLARVLPILRLLPSYDAGWFGADVIAGLTLWGILVPEGIAYAGLAGAPVQAGLYTV